MIQCLVIPLCLQCRRIDHRKEQKADFDALLAKRVAEKKANVAVIKAVHNVARLTVWEAFALALLRSPRVP
ncbi:hypothetical protein H0H92_009025 [Tricholoma furcatifolium]|nr:hypothetical protein H0H92_009025 [Tricholoma furcatifolium]